MAEKGYYDSGTQGMEFIVSGKNIKILDECSERIDR